MKHICNECGKVFQANDMTIHYMTAAVCPLCLEKYLEKIKRDTERKEEDIERRKLKMKW